MNDSDFMILFVTTIVAGLILWRLRRALKPSSAANGSQTPGPDSLCFEMATGSLVAAGARVSQLLGYRSARDCLENFNHVEHFKNASLVSW